MKLTKNIFAMSYNKQKLQRVKLLTLYETLLPWLPHLKSRRRLVEENVCEKKVFV